MAMEDISFVCLVTSETLYSRCIMHNTFMIKQSIESVTAARNEVNNEKFVT